MSEILSLWNNTPTRQAILDFVAAVTDENSPDYVPSPERIAAFDNDGTLWCERPVYIQFQGALDFLAVRAEADASLRHQQPYKAAYEKDTTWLTQYLSNEKIPKLLVMLVKAAAGETQAEFEARAADWLRTARHPRFDVPYTNLVYQPMLQLLDYLRRHDFRIFICSGGGMDYVRLVSEKLYGIPRENVIGSNLILAWEYRKDGPVLVRQAGLVEPFNDGPGKPVNIQLHVGRPPILTGGNSNGDIAMMEFAEASGKPFLNLLVRHDDETREYAYDHSAERAQQLTSERHWTMISIKGDWLELF